MNRDNPTVGGRPNSRDNILDAALRVTARDGAGNLTLDKVAAECGLSKGGLLYNYPSKEALLQAMLERLLHSHRQRMDEEYSRLEGQPEATLRAFLRAWKHDEQISIDASLAIIAAAAQNPGLLQPLREHFREIHERISRESANREQALMIWAAADGLLLHRIMDLAPYSHDDKAAMFNAMLRLAGENTDGTGGGNQ
ncbi:MAG: TetR/AcrR family transcriptional regulator [Pseudomonadota bacterium]